MQIGHKLNGKFVLDKHVGSALLSSPDLITILESKAKLQLDGLRQQQQPQLFAFPVKSVPAKLTNWHITGFHQVFGTVYDQLGFPAGLLRELCIGRIVYPKSKLATVDYFHQYLGIDLSISQVYRFLDTIEKTQLVATASAFVSHKPTGFSFVLYDVTTLHFETTVEDNLRQKGFAKNHRNDLPQVLVGLFVDPQGYPFDFDVFSGSTFEGHTLQTVVTDFKVKHQISELTIVADAGMLSLQNLQKLKDLQVHYIVGARIKNLAKNPSQLIFNHDFSVKEIFETNVSEYGRLIVEYSASRATKNKRDREKSVAKITLDLQSHKPMLRKRKYLTVLNINNSDIVLNQAQIDQDTKFDGLKGYYTNLDNTHQTSEVISHYKNLWKVESAFRMSKSDFRERPIYHAKEQRILAHLCICFVALLVGKETEKILKDHCSLQQAILLLGKVGKGIAKVDKLELEIESEVDLETQEILDTVKQYNHA